MKKKTNAINMTSLGEVMQQYMNRSLHPKSDFDRLMEKLSLRRLKIKPDRKIHVTVNKVILNDDETGDVFFHPQKSTYTYGYLCRLRRKWNV